MKVYHGSIVIVEHPETSRGRKNLDFGQGFYLTDIEQQAIEWATRPINHGKPQYLNCYELNIDGIKAANYRYKKFEKYDDAWLDFVLANRHGKTPAAMLDMVEGGIANDRVFNTIELYDAGLITRQEALSRLAYEQPNSQMCILCQEIVDKYLTFITAKRLG
ncbi:MAG: DUF3990 domain-containing protein [Prevotella sp.]|nr:DUF3990 domain-containing protein [Prevotella sp.]